MKRRILGIGFSVIIGSASLIGAGFTQGTASAALHSTTVSTTATTDPWKSMPALTTVQFVNQSVGWIGGKGVLYKTTDGGRHFSKVYAGKETVKDIDFLNTQVGFVAFDDFTWRTVDGGAHWVKTQGFLDDLDMVSATTGFGRQNTSVYAITNYTSAGRYQATRRNPPVPVDDISFTNANIGYASGGGKVYKTTDGAHTWTQVFKTSFIKDSGPWKTRVIASGNDVWLMVYGGAAGMNQVAYVIYHSADGGHTWNAILDEGYFATVYGGNLHPVNDQGIGAQPGPFTVLGGKSAYFTGWNVDDLLVTYTTNGGKTFVRRDLGSSDKPGLPDFFSGLAVSFPDARDGWIVGSRNGGHGVALHTQDSGATWKQMK